MVSFSNKIFLVAVMGIALLASAVQVEAIEQPGNYNLYFYLSTVNNQELLLTPPPLLSACIARGNKCVGEPKPCCKGTTCAFYANRCVGA